MLRLAAATAVWLVVAASPAAAATVAPLKPCYVSAGPTDAERETVVIAGDGFTQESVVEVLFDGVAMGSARTGSVGEFRIQVPAPFQAAGQRAFTVTARDAATAVSVTSRVTNLGMTVKPRNTAPGRRVRFSGRGFTRGAPVFGHYLFRGREQKTVRLARRSRRPCGTFSARRRLIPVARARAGRWMLQVDQRRAYSPEPDPVWVRRPIDVVRVRP